VTSAVQPFIHVGYSSLQKTREQFFYPRDAAAS